MARTEDYAGLIAQAFSLSVKSVLSAVVSFGVFVVSGND